MNCEYSVENNILFADWNIGFAQSGCNLKTATNDKISALTIKDVKCISRESRKKNLIFYTFGVWCEPCRLLLPNAVALSKKYNTEFYVLLVDLKMDKKTSRAIELLKEADSNIKIAVLQDSIYGLQRKNRNAKLVTEATPKLENIDDYSKDIVFDQTGKVLRVTNWKDNRDIDWHDDSKMTDRLIVQLIK